MSGHVYVVVDPDCDGGVRVERVYLNEAEAHAYVTARNECRYDLLEVEEHDIGAPAAEYDGPVHVATWTTRRKLKGEKQLILVTEDGFTMVVPSAVPTSGGYRYREYFGPPEPDPEYESPAVWIDNLHTHKEWHTGNTPPAAEVTERRLARVVVRGTNPGAVDALVRETALQVKAERRGEPA